MKYLSKPMEVEAEKFVKGVNLPPNVRYNPKSSPEAFFRTKHGDIIIESGDYVVTDPFGNMFVMDEKRFNETYIVK